jgi:hypothetical protein
MYRVIGIQIVITIPLSKEATATWQVRLVSVTATELVIEGKKGDAVLKMHHRRAK